MVSLYSTHAQFLIYPGISRYLGLPTAQCETTILLENWRKKREKHGFVSYGREGEFNAEVGAKSSMLHFLHMTIYTYVCTYNSFSV